MALRVQIRGKAKADMQTENPILLLREIGVETDTGRMKIGDGVTAWNSLAYSLGTATWLSGSVDPTTEGIDGDYYFNTATCDVFKKVGGSWGTAVANIKGAPGTPGTNGTDIANNLTETVTGKALDATQGKVLADLVSTKLTKFVGTTAGTSTALTINITDATLSDFANIQVRLHTDIGTNATLNLNSLGAKPIYVNTGLAVASGAKTGSMLNLMYNATLSRWYILDNLYVGMGDTPIKNVWQTWVQLAGLNPSDYADLATVVADATIMTTLANSTQAVDYMIDSTGAIMTAVVGSVNAMTKIGLSSYATTSFIANSTWVTAITASTNAITGLEASSPLTTPTMTSNTAPSGVASWSFANVLHDAYFGFDKVAASTSIAATYPTPTTFPCRLIYDFGSNYMWAFVAYFSNTEAGGCGYAVTGAKIQGSLNGSTWVDLGTFNIPASTSNRTKIILTGATTAKYRYFCIMQPSENNSGSGQGMMSLTELELFGK